MTSHLWTYQTPEGERLCALKLDGPPPLGWPVMMVGPEMGPCRHYVVVKINDEDQILTLEQV